MRPSSLISCAFFAIVSYAILTVFWKPISAVIGWLWIPIGQASLYVFVWQVFFALAIASIPGVPSSSSASTTPSTSSILRSGRPTR